jgi:hypothetical protein
MKGELQLTDIVSAFHLMVAGEKMSKSRGNFYSGDQLLDEKGLFRRQIRYYLALLGLSGQVVGLRLRQAGRAQQVPGRPAERRLRTTDLRRAFQVRGARARGVCCWTAW